MAILGRIEHLLNKIKKRRAFELSNYLKPNCVVFLDEHSRNDAVKTLTDSLYESSQIHERALFTQALLARETQGSTAIGDGIAVPHTKNKLYNHFFLAIGIVKGNGLIWDEEHPDPIHFIFLIGGPDNKPEEYLELLSHLTTSVKGKDERAALLACATPQEVFDRLSEF